MHDCAELFLHRLGYGLGVVGRRRLSLADRPSPRSGRNASGLDAFQGQRAAGMEIQADQHDIDDRNIIHR
jgi:hypothetical protein